MKRWLRPLCILALVALLAAGCAPEVTADKSDTATKGVVDKTGAAPGGAAEKAGAGTASKAAAGTRRFPGSVCSLLTPAEIEAVVKLGSPVTVSEGSEPGTDRSCAYLVQQAYPAVVLTLQGELEPLDVGGLRTLPQAKSAQLRGAEALYWPTTAVVYVIKNGLAVTVQVVVPPAGETAESAELKLAQAIADRLP